MTSNQHQSCVQSNEVIS